MISQSANRVSSQTDRQINERIRRRTEMSIAYHAEHPDQIQRRLEELDREWDVERALETAASSFSLFGLTMSVARGRRWLLLPFVVQGFFLQHAIQGWCPPLPVVRRLGFRTRTEIDIERYALKALRGDFQGLPQSKKGRGVAPVLEAVRR